MIVSLIVSGALVYKFFLLNGFSFSLAEVTELRLSRGRDSSLQQGSTFAGIIGMAFSGFFVLAYIFCVYFQKYLSKSKARQLFIVFIIGIFVSFLSGGRFVAAIALLIAYLSNYAYKLRFGIKKKSKLSSKLLYILLGFVVIYVFSIIFIDRTGHSSGDSHELMLVLDNNLPGLAVPDFIRSYFSNNPEFAQYYFVLASTVYYACHGVFQFDVLYSADYPEQAPYFFAYQFYLQGILVNKLGLNVVSIQEILASIPNPGVYFTLAGAFYLDFGAIGSLPVIFIVAIFGAYFWSRFLIVGDFFSFYISLLFLTLIVFSPIVAITSAGVYPSLIILIFCLKLFIPKGRLAFYQEGIHFER
ncbi:hypothetical protein GCM10009092_17560 [Bowmanella denitrificans]|uniref:Oligosaccharide repeat unit polymerase n=2 Tax=Bowmanella denitrificans TaxID=366582 RepID=A0ABP3GWW8_9ALTE